MLEREVLIWRTDPEMRDAIRYIADKSETTMTMVLWLAVKEFLDKRLPGWNGVKADAA